MHGVLPALLGSWCLAHASSMARPLRLLLEAGNKFSQVVLGSAGAVSYIASGRFLCAAKDFEESIHNLMLLADLGCLELLQNCQRWDWLRAADVGRVLAEDALVPLTQLHAFRQELRQTRFCSPVLAEARALPCSETLVNSVFSF